MDALRQVLEMDRGDSEIVGYALDTLCNITAKESFEDEGLYTNFSENCFSYSE